MKRYIYIVFLLLMSVQLAIAQSTRYEYWFDNDYEGRTISSTTEMNLSLDIDISQQHPGLHYFNIRTQDETTKQWGGMARYMYMAQDAASTASLASYEYWFDNDYKDRTVVTGVGSVEPLTLDISHLPPGLHYFNFRTQGKSGTWGGLAHYLFMVKNDIKDISSLEYWIDDDRSHSQSVDVKDSTIMITMDISDLDVGISHTFNIFGKSTSSVTNIVEAYEFTIEKLPLVPTPVVTHNGDTITISDGENPDTEYPIEYYYTTDGSKPNKSSIKYDGPFVITRNCTLKVTGVQYAHDYSEVAELTVDWFKVANPVASQSGNKLTISTTTPDASIYYKIGEGDEHLYSEPIRLPNQSKVQIVGKRDGYNNSDTITYQPRAIKSATPVVTYDGRYLKLSSNEGGVKFYYTVDDTSPTDSLDVAAEAIAYDGRLVIENMCTVRAVAIIDSMNVSDVNVYPIEYLYTGDTAYVSREGVLPKAFEWCGGMNTREVINVVGPLNNNDLDSLRAIPVLAYLDLGKASLTSHQIPADAFAESQIISFVSPTDVTDAGGRLFADCPRLATVVWNADISMKDNTFENIDNPNLLVYVNNESLKPSGIKNIVVDGVAENIELKDTTTGNNNFYSPREFIAKNISYTHDYQQETKIGITQGWETLVLPFDVQTIMHEKNGALKPFYAEGDGLPFWLMELAPDSLEFAHAILANTPYIISMPNNPEVYSDEFNQKGKVTFEAQNATIPISQLREATGAGVTLRPTYSLVTHSSDVLAINVGKAQDGHPEGSVFIADSRDVRPFEAYMLPTETNSRIFAVRSLIGGNGVTAIDNVLMKKDNVNNSVVRVYSLSGTLLKKGKQSEVINNLPKGIYIINGKKKIIR